VKLTEKLTMTKGDAGLAQVVRRHLHVDLVADADADKIFAHLAGNMGQDLMAVGKRDAEHRSGQDLGNGPRQFNGFFFCHELFCS